MTIVENAVQIVMLNGQMRVRKGVLSSIRVMCIRRSKNMARETKKEEHRLLELVTESEKDLTNLNESQKVMYEINRQQLDIMTRRAKRAIVASGAKWVEEGEKVTAYFLSRGKQLSAQKTINEIKENGQIIRDNGRVLEYCAKYYEHIFRSTGVDRATAEQFLSSNEIPKLTKEESEHCEGIIDSTECKAALPKMNKNKAPGVSGFTPEFFLHFWDDIGGILIRIYQSSIHSRLIYNTTKRCSDAGAEKGDHWI